MWAPVGLRYHALHHLFPTLPYHNLKAAHEYLLVHLPPESPYRSLDETRAAYYERYRFADVFANVVRAPKTLVDQIRVIPGVATAEIICAGGRSHPDFRSAL